MKSLSMDPLPSPLCNRCLTGAVVHLNEQSQANERHFRLLSAPHACTAPLLLDALLHRAPEPNAEAASSVPFSPCSTSLQARKWVPEDPGVGTFPHEA